jgi:urease accessory protein
MRTEDSGALLSLLHLCDSLFPIGGFAHADGLEAAAAGGLVTGGPALRQWMQALLDEGLGRLEGPAVLLAWEHYQYARWEAIERLDEELHALRSSAAGRQASRGMGGRMIRLWQTLHPSSQLEIVAARLPAAMLPVAFAVSCASSGIGSRATVEAFFYTRLASTASAAMRLMAIGQHEAHTIVAELLAGVPQIVDDVMHRHEAPGAFVPALDLAAMSHQYVHSRLFRS